jgi:predicted acylesterase/phospholipase RssA
MKQTAVLLVAVIFAWGCVSTPKRNPLPETLVEEAEIPGIPDAREWGDTPLPHEDEWFAQSEEELRARYPALFGQEHHYLAISGGGAKGAFGAGLLKGWTASGTRPEFSMVTGISTGSLTAPFAFLGPEYDDVIEEMYTNYSTKDLINRRTPLNALTSDAMAGTKKLKALIDQYMSDEVLAAIAAEYKRGRILNIGTTNLDAERPVIWSIGHIAASGEPGAYELIRQVILASAALPAIFPPVMVEVEVQGKRYDELHVDGGAASQVFLYPASLDWERVLEKFEVKGTPEVYVIRNSQLTTKPATVKRKLLPIGERAMSSIIKNQGIGDLYRIYALTERDGVGYNAAWIPADFHEESTEEFDPKYMRKLFDRGYEMAKGNYPWAKLPPEFEEPED